MSVYKDKKRGTYYCQFNYKNNLGETKRVTKRGFDTKREAVQWEREFMLRQSGSTDMLFEEFAERYEEEIAVRIKESTYYMKVKIIDSKIIPYFSGKRLIDITTADVMLWQNKLLQYRDPETGKSYSSSYLKTVHNQLSAMLNHAVRYYNLPQNPARIVGNMGNDKSIRINYWTREEYEKFAEVMRDKAFSYYAFEVLYWTGIRLGEMLALTPGDIDFENGTISVTKTYHRFNGKDIITDPKTPKSVRTVRMPEFLTEELMDYLELCYKPKPDERLFPVSKDYIEAELRRGIKKANLKKIRVHDLRHSHVSLLINMGYSAVAIADRCGHESIHVTYRYSHMFPSVQVDMVDKLNEFRM